MRFSSDQPKNIRVPFVLACKVGHMMNLTDEDLGRLESGKYDIVMRSEMITVIDGHVTSEHYIRVRRVS